MAAILDLCKWGLSGTASTCVPFLKCFYWSKVPSCQKETILLWFAAMVALTTQLIEACSHAAPSSTGFLAGFVKRALVARMACNQFHSTVTVTVYSWRWGRPELGHTGVVWGVPVTGREDQQTSANLHLWTRCARNQWVRMIMLAM